jgi:hypothetical protein
LKKVESKQSPKGRRFAGSGHPVHERMYACTTHLFAVWTCRPMWSRCARKPWRQKGDRRRESTPKIELHIYYMYTYMNYMYVPRYIGRIKKKLQSYKKRIIDI